jgi:hypothetical protein
VDRGCRTGPLAELWTGRAGCCCSIRLMPGLPG